MSRVKEDSIMVHRLCRFAALLACFVATQAFAGITLLSPTPQRAKLGETFSPLQVRVTDDAGNPMVDAAVRYSVPTPPFGPVDTTSNSGCIIDAGKQCTTRTDAQGIASTHPLTAAQARTQPATIRFGLESGSYQAVAELFVDPVVPPMTITVASGANQRTAVGTAFPQPFVVRVLTASGNPVSGARVDFTGTVSGVFNSATLELNGALGTTVSTDANGLASAFARVQRGIGPGIVRAQVTDPTANVVLTVDIPYSSTTFDGSNDLDLENMWWSGFAENGWGLSVAQLSDRLFPVLYVYDDNGNPTWRVIAAGGWSGNARYEYYLGSQYKPKGTPYYAYDASRFSVGVAGPATTIQFHSEIAANLSFLVDQDFPPKPMNKAIALMDFGPDVPPRMPGVGGMWWGGQSQAGWGISLMEQPGGLFAVWFTYDANGDPTWFVMPTGTWENDSTYSGTLYKTHSSPWFNATYDPSKLTVTSVGTFRFRFVNVNNATFEWTAEGRAGSMGLVRTEF
jgi:hypothetical protein